MKIGLQRFTFFLDQLQKLFSKAATQKNPALWLYANNARTPLFMLEGLSKLYGDLHNKKKFSKLKMHFKLLEDAIGAIDYYDTVAKEFEKNKKIPATVINYLQAQTREKIQYFNELLVEEKWLGADKLRVTKIQKKLLKVDWLNEEKEITAIQEFYGKSIYEILEFLKTKQYRFDNMELDVHELRRKLRWLSIYPQAMKGSIQLGANKASPQHLKKYLTKEIVNSPYNVMPEVGTATCFLMLEKKYFLSLSWMIADLGKLKDSGLNVIALKEALQQTSALKETACLNKAYQLLGNTKEKIPVLLNKATATCKLFIKEQNLENMLMGIKLAKKLNTE